MNSQARFDRMAAQLTQQKWVGDITKEELQKHNKKESCWCVFDGYVYDLTSYINSHPGGSSTILACAGGDMTEPFKRAHRYLPITIIEKLKIGKLV